MVKVQCVNTLGRLVMELVGDWSTKDTRPYYSRWMSAIATVAWNVPQRFSYIVGRATTWVDV